MIDARDEELPGSLTSEFRRAKRLEWLTIAYLCADIVLVYLVLGGSQAVRAAWIESFLELIPPVVFLVSVRYMNRPPSRKFPYGLHRVTSVAHLCAGIALLFVGGFLLYISANSLLHPQPVSIGTLELFGLDIWRGWLMIAIMFDSIVAILLGRAKRRPARALHDKVLDADADMNRADWLTAVAAIVGVLGIRFGLWWVDPVAAGFISLNILMDGYRNSRIAVFDLMDMEPTLVGGETEDPLVVKVKDTLQGLPWVAEVDLRSREEGRIYFFEAQVVPVDERDLLDRLADARDRVMALDWRVFSIGMTPVRALDEERKKVA
ncbi:MAG TPA: cation diffusion facilitator family transporter [Trueperaceae bacterium]